MEDDRQKIIEEDRKKYPELSALLDEMKTYEKKIFIFDHEENDFKPTGYSDKVRPEEDGTYLTIRCGLSGIYTILNEWKDNQWQLQITDGSTTIAFCPKKVELQSMKKNG